MYKRPIFDTLIKRFSEERKFIQVLSGPRQTGKTTLARQLIESVSLPTHYVTADEPNLKSVTWIEQQWEVARLQTKNKFLLIFDEIQKIPTWSESVKRLWDNDTANQRPIHVLLLGSSPLLVQQGLTESLAGRFEIIPIMHWSYEEMHNAFGWDIDKYVFFGGYPGSATLIQDEQRWSNYILNSLIETTLARDILLMRRIDKPALLRRLFELACMYSGQILSYQKMLGQLHDVGNTTTLAHYLKILEDAGLITGLAKYAGQRVRQRASSPKLLVQNTALISIFAQKLFSQAKADAQFWGRMVESVVGASLFNAIKGKGLELFYWNDRNREVDFILAKGNELIAIEVKSNYRKPSLPGIETFSKLFGVEKKLLVGGDGTPLHEFLRFPVEALFNR